MICHRYCKKKGRDFLVPPFNDFCPKRHKEIHRYIRSRVRLQRSSSQWVCLMSLNRSILTIFFLSVICIGGCKSFFGGEKSTQISTMTREELSARMLLADPNIIILDVRAPEQWENSKKLIRGAIHKDSGKVATWSNKYPKSTRLVVYSSPDEKTSIEVAQKLASLDFTGVYVLKGGWNKWQEAGFPMDLK